jgi:hypothetical protein
MPEDSLGNDREDNTMTELTPRQILDAISRALEKTAGQFTKDKPDQMHRHRQAGESVPVIEEQAAHVERQA